MTSWNHLPTAKHIDRVLSSVKTHQRLWADAYDSIRKTDAYYAAWHHAAFVPRGATYNAARDALSASGARGSVYHAAQDTLITLFTYDDCAYMFDSDPGELAILAALGDQRALLLQSACIAFNKEKELV